jgi:hypothetical protein
MGFETSESIPVMRMYYHYFDFQNVSKYMDFPINNRSLLQFNQFNLDNPTVTLPSHQEEKLSSRQTGNKSYVQAGTGIVTRLEFPYLRNIRELHENLQVLKAELVVEPVRNTYKSVKLPERTSLYITDNVNRFGNPIRTPITNDIVIGDLVIDEVYQEETSYTYDITDFINAKLIEPTDDVPALLLTISTEELYKTVDRLILGNQDHPDNNIKLKIYYMSYE